MKQAGSCGQTVGSGHYRTKVQTGHASVEQSGEKVRIVRKKDTFEEGFTSNWTEEVFAVSEVKHTNPITYSVKDELGEPIKGTFYEQDLQSSAQEIFRVCSGRRKIKYTSSGKLCSAVSWKLS